MCDHCGCSGSTHDPEHPHDHDHDHDHDHHEHEPGRGVQRLEARLLAANDAAAARVRRRLADRGQLCLNLVSSPGAGKTTLLERTLSDLGGEFAFAVVEGDQATERDAERIRRTGTPVVQVQTGTGCHLDGTMVERALDSLAPPAGAIVLVENVGNLVCPALFDLGERAKVLVASTPEGDDKPFKYPHMFRVAGLVLLNKVDLAPHVGFDDASFERGVRATNPDAPILPISATRGDGLDAWYSWIRRHAGARMEARR